MAILDLSSFAGGLKTIYTEREIRNLVYKSNPFTAMVPKFEEFYGDSRKIPLIYGNPQNIGANFAVANSIGSTSRINAFLLTRISNYSLG